MVHGWSFLGQRILCIFHVEYLDLVNSWEFKNGSWVVVFGSRDSLYFHVSLNIWIWFKIC